jgi:hypothetical protein
MEYQSEEQVGAADVGRGNKTASFPPRLIILRTQLYYIIC